MPIVFSNNEATALSILIDLPRARPIPKELNPVLQVNLRIIMDLIYP
ncbi:MAG: hypothetical protein RLZZ241_1734 [Bacteroidota bacterium]|jgi:hypothetical protein